MRIRPRSDAPYEYVEVDPDDLDPALDTFGVEPETTWRYRQRATEQARRGRPLERGTNLNLGQIGANTTFPSPRAAAKIFIENNAHFFENPSFEDVDAYDATLDFMDGIDVRLGKRYVKLSKTRRGEQILRAGGLGGAAIARAMLEYLFGQAGKRRRWRDVPWGLVDEYLQVLREAMADDAARRGAARPSSAPMWYPLASGLYASEDMLTLAVEQLGEANAERLAAWLNSQELYDLADRLGAVLSPPKGIPGRAGRRARRCLGKANRKVVAARKRQIEHWAAYPAEIPSWTCVSTQATEASSAALCLFPGLDEEVSRVERACDRPYDPSWPSLERQRLCARGQVEPIDQFGSGVAPLGCQDVEAEPEMDLPWERNPKFEHGQWIAKRRTARGTLIYLWPDGALTWAMGQYVKGSPHARTPEQIEKALTAGWMVFGEVELYDDDEVPDLIRAARWAADRGLDPGAMRERLHAPHVMKPVWTVIETDRDGRPKVRSWILPRIAWPGLAVWSEKGEYSVWSEIGRSGSYQPTGMTFTNLRDLTKYLEEVRQDRRKSNPAPSKKDLDAAVKAMQLYLGSVDFASLKDQQRFHTRASRAVSKVATVAGIDDIAAWEQIEKEARRRGLVRPVPGKHMNPRKAPEVWSCPSGPGEYVDVYKEYGKAVDDDEIYAAADIYSVFPDDVRDDWHVRYGSIALPSGPIWVVRHSGIEYFFTNNASWREEMDDLVAKLYPEENPGRRSNPSPRACRIGSRISNP
jgi:hypothetical protein